MGVSHMVVNIRGIFWRIGKFWEGHISKGGIFWEGGVDSGRAG